MNSLFMNYGSNKCSYLKCFNKRISRECYCIKHKCVECISPVYNNSIYCYVHHCTTSNCNNIKMYGDSICVYCWFKLIYLKSEVPNYFHKLPWELVNIILGVSIFK